MVTLTYAATASWEPKQVSTFLRRVAEWARRRRIRIPYAWVLELTKAGNPHYHVLFWLPKGYRLPKPDKRGWWSYGSTRIEAVKSTAAGYIAKYVSKGPLALGQDDEIPEGARISGRGGLPRQSDAAREARWWRLPTWLRDALPLARRDDGVLGNLPRRVLIKNDYPDGRRFVRRGKSIRLEPLHRSLLVDDFGVVHFSPWAAMFCRSSRRIIIRRKSHAAA